MTIVKMYGPSISDPSKIVNRDVPECDIEAYKAAGYKRGSIDEELPAAEPVVAPEPPPVPAKRTRAKKG